MSHSSRQKLFVKELRKYVPEHIDLWVDEKRLIIGDDINKTLHKTISEDVDFLILVIDRDAAKSKWVHQEYEWAVQREKQLGRTFVLPILLEEEIWEYFGDSDLKSRKYIKCYEFTDLAIQSAGAQLISELFHWVSKQLFEKNKKDKSGSSAILKIEEAENLLMGLAEKIRLLVYPYRESNPLDLVKLLDLMKEQDALIEYDIFEFNEFLIKLKKSGLLTGLVSDGESIWVKQEHHAWKKSIHTSNKSKIAKKAISFIESGMRIALDSGSTTLEIAKQMSHGLKMERWTNLTVVTNSIPVAQELLSFSSESGLEDNNPILRVFMTEGRIRPNSLAVVNDHEIYDNILSGFQETLSKMGGAHVCFVGANGLYMNMGFAVHNDFEIRTKSGLLANSDRKVIVCDSSKFSISERKMFVGFDEYLEIITTSEGSEAEIDRMNKVLADTNSKLVLADES